MRALAVRALLGALIVAIAFASWMIATGRQSIDDISVPTSYSGDALGVLSQIKAYGAGDIRPFVLKEVSHLGAPYGANWTDYPTEDLIYFVAGLFAKAFGLFAGSNLYLVGVQALAGIAFLACATALRYSIAASFAGAVLYTLAPYVFYRNVGHLSLATYWHVPLFLFAVVWASGRMAPPDSGRMGAPHALLAALGAVLAGLLNPYYLAAFGWIAGWVWIGSAVSRNGRAFLRASLLLALAAVAFAVQSLDSIWMNHLHGANWEAVHRNLDGLDQFGLRLPDLAFPYFHRWERFESWSRATYHSIAPGGGANRGEAAMAYMGAVPFAALFGLLAAGTVRLAARQFERISDWYWPALALIAFAVVGGIDYFFGAFGLVLVRGTNRYTIVLAAIALFWLCERLTMAPRGARFAAVAAMLLVGPWDQVPEAGRIVPIPGRIRTVVDSDAAFVRQVEAALPRGAMVLQLPIKPYPESGLLNAMGDYEHFRPYLYSADLRFSYGTTKGRGDSRWQSLLASLPLDEVVLEAARYGFSAIYLNRNAYRDRGASMMEPLQKSLGPPIAMTEDLVAFRIHPATERPELPPAGPGARFSGFSYVEQADGHFWAWATAQDASVVMSPPYIGMHRVAGGRQAYELRFVLEPFNTGAVAVEVDGRPVAALAAGEAGKAVSLRLPPGKTEWRLAFHCDRPPVAPGGGDRRRLAFRIRDWRLDRLENAPKP